LVITDILMPVMDGYEFVRQLRLNPATSRIPVLLYTAPYGEREARAFALSGGVPYILTKPIDPDEVMRIVSRVLASGAEPPAPLGDPGLVTAIDREHLRLLTDKLSERTEDLRAANARLRALVNIGLDFISLRDSDRRIQRVCEEVADLFGATYATLGLVDRINQTVRSISVCGSSGETGIMIGAQPPGIIGTVVSERRTVRGHNPGGASIGLQLPTAHPPIHAYLAAPVASPTYVYGWLCLVGNEQQQFSEEDEQLVAALGGQVGRILGLECEIAERQQAEAALRHERDRAQRYLDTAEVILVALDLEGRITLLNRKGCDLLGWRESELLGRDWIDTCLPERLRPELRLRFRDLLAGDLSTLENSVVTRSGDERMIEWCNTLVRDDNGRLIGTFSSGTDITKRHKGEQALRTAEERMRFALSAASVGIWDMNYKTGELQWSEILEGQYGLRLGEFAGTFAAFLDRIHPDDRAAVTDTIDAAVISGDDFSVSHRAVWPDGTVRLLNGFGRVVVDEHGKPVRAIGISQDVTERRALEQQIRQTQKMEAIGGLAAGLAHDFNNLLTVILGYCELIVADLPRDALHLADVQGIQGAGESAAALTRQLLAFSRKQIIEPTVLDLNLVVADTRRMLKRLIREDVKIVVSLQSDLPSIKADRGQLEQVILNLAVNGRDAMPGGGTLTIETGNLRHGAPCSTTPIDLVPGDYVVLTVTDTGTGITPAVQARLFEPFFTTKEVGHGTGLGLATVHGIVMQGGGYVEVRTEIGRGTSFVVYFPGVDVSAPVVAGSGPAPRRSTGVETVLVVEDSDELRKLTKRMLARKGYSVLVAANAAEALPLFDRNPAIDLVLTDVVMPEVSGPALAKQLVKQRPTVAVLYMSGHTASDIVHHGVLLPGIAFLQKPFSSEALGQKIREVLDREPPVNHSAELPAVIQP